MTLDGNKDEADKCIEIAQSAFSAGNPEKAEKFLLKAERLYPSARAKELLTAVRAAGSTASSPKRTAEVTSNEEVRRRKTPTHAAPQREYTQDQLEAVRRIKTKCKDYYEILGVTKEATDSDIKKSYKKLALQLHPDKNHAPGASEAFKAIGNAAAILTDPEKRKQYDIRGSEPVAPTHHHHQYYARGFESDLTAEELFNMFFGAAAFGGAGAGAGGNVYARRRAREPEAREAHGGLVQLLPVAVLVLLSMMSGFFINEPVFSLAPTAKYSVPRETINMKVPYYVKENFHTDYQGSLRRLELAIEEEYIVGLRHACQRERNYRDSMAWKARNFGDSAQYADAQRLRTPSCEKLNNLQR